MLRLIQKLLALLLAPFRKWKGRRVLRRIEKKHGARHDRKAELRKLAKSLPRLTSQQKKCLARDSIFRILDRRNRRLQRTHS